MIPKLAQHAAARLGSSSCRRPSLSRISPPSTPRAAPQDRLIRGLPRAADPGSSWTGKPLIMSTGAAPPDDIDFGVRRRGGRAPAPSRYFSARRAILRPLSSLNLLAIPWLSDQFEVAVGLSDHSIDPVLAPTIAVALGATVIEKHFTLDRRLPGPDHPFALEPDELARMVRASRSAAEALGVPGKVIGQAEAELRAFAVRAIHATRPIKAGEALVEGKNLDVLRPGARPPGLHPRYLDSLVGRCAARDIDAGEGISADAVAPPLGQAE